MSVRNTIINAVGVRVVIIIACLSLLSGAAIAADSMKDVPPGHWAYQAVQLMISKGYLPTYNDGTFKGDNPVDRYTLANVVAKLLKELDKDNVKVSDQDLLTIRTLSVEFREDLVAQGVRVDEFDKRLKTLESMKLDSVKTDVANLKADVASLKGAVNSKTNAADSLKAEMASADTRLSEQIAQQNLKIKELSSTLGQSGSSADYQNLRKEYDTYKKNTQTELAILKAGVIAALLLALIH